MKKSGAELIAIERQEQIEKHGRTIESDVEVNDAGELKQASLSLITGMIEDFPEDWGRGVFNKIMLKSEIERLTIAGALICAEIDRLQAIEE